MENQIWYDSSGTPTKLTDIKYGSFHYHADVGVSGKMRLGNVCSAYIEFDYLLSNGVTFSIGDALNYKQVFPEQDQFFDPADTDYVRDRGTYYITSIDDDGKTCHVTAFDAVSKLDVDFSKRLKELESDFPMSISTLLNEVASVAGLTVDTTYLDNTFINSTVNRFYANGITCRDVVKAVAELNILYVRANGSTITFGQWFVPLQKSVPSQPYDKGFVVCPDDGTYTYFRSQDRESQLTNVWYKENGLHIGEAISLYDAAYTYDSLGHTPSYEVWNYVSPLNVYEFFIANNFLAQSGITGSSSLAWDLRSGITDIFIPLKNSARDTYDYISGTIRLFPFRNPFDVGNGTLVVDADGNYHWFPIMSIDLSESEVVIESYSDKTVGSEAQNGMGSGGEDRSLALDVRVTALESQKIDGFTLVNFASVSAGTISTYDSRSFSDYVWLVAEWVVNSSIRATTMFRRADFENAPYVSMFYVDSQNTQRWCELSYVDDTTLSITASSNASGNIALFGLAYA